MKRLARFYQPQRAVTAEEAMTMTVVMANMLMRVVVSIYAKVTCSGRDET